MFRSRETRDSLALSQQHRLTMHAFFFGQHPPCQPSLVRDAQPQR